MDAAQIAADLHRIGAVRFGSFTLKDGSESPFYIDLRSLIAHPSLLKRVAGAMVQKAASIPHDCVAGIPYAGLPVAVAMSLDSGVPLVYPRKEAKDYGTKRRVEGVFEAGARALVIDDVVTSGGAKLEAVAPLRDAGLVVEDVMVVVDRQGPGTKVLADAGLRLHSLLNIRELFACLRAAKLVSAEELRVAELYLDASRTNEN